MTAIERLHYLSPMATLNYWDDQDHPVRTQDHKDDYIRLLGKYTDPEYKQLAAFTSQTSHKVISVPRQVLDRCDVCGSKKRLKVCISCASSVYCSQECQKKHWKSHSASCTQSQKINLRTFYPVLAYLVDYFRRVGEPNTPFHPAMQSKILQAPIPAPRKASRPNERLRQVVVLGEEYHLEQPGALANWWHGKQGLLTGVDDQMKLMFQVLREINTFEITIAICLVLLTDLYSAEDPLDDGPAGPYYRLEYGQDPISDFGICKGKIRGTTHCVQVWAYRDAKTGTEHTYNDPDNHYWIYFKTLTGDEVTLDCNSYSFGMETLVDVETLIKKIPDYMVIDYNTRVPALLRGRMDRGSQPYVLIEEKRFSVMRDTRLHQAILTRFPNDDTPEDKRIIREFMEKVFGQEVEKRQEDRLWRYRMFGSLMLREVLEGQMWKSLGKPIIHRTDNFLSPRPLRVPNHART